MKSRSLDGLAAKDLFEKLIIQALQAGYQCNPVLCRYQLTQQSPDFLATLFYCINVTGHSCVASSKS